MFEQDKREEERRKREINRNIRGAWFTYA